MMMENAGKYRNVRRIRQLRHYFCLVDISESAAVFFKRIGNETGTCVIWPSRLKIGAKSKTVVVKGCEWEGSHVKEVTLLLMEHLCHQIAATVPVVMTMEI